MSLPIVILFYENWDTKGIHGPVCGSYPGTGSDKRPPPLKICFLQSGIKPNIALIIQRTGNRVED